MAINAISCLFANSEESGEIFFNELINRSLIQTWFRTNVYVEVKSCRVDDTILDVIVSKSIEENFVSSVGVLNLTIGTQNRVHRLSPQVGKQGNSIPLTSLVLSHVRSLIVLQGLGEIPSLAEFRPLCVLDFEGFSHLQDHHLENVMRLFQLRGTLTLEIRE